MKYRLVCSDCLYAIDITGQNVIDKNYKDYCPICGNFLSMQTVSEKVLIKQHELMNEFKQHSIFMKQKIVISKNNITDFVIDIHRLSSAELFKELTKDIK